MDYSTSHSLSLLEWVRQEKYGHRAIRHALGGFTYVLVKWSMKHRSFTRHRVAVMIREGLKGYQALFSRCANDMPSEESKGLCAKVAESIGSIGDRIESGTEPKTALDEVWNSYQALYDHLGRAP